MFKEDDSRINRLEEVLIKHMEKVDENACGFTKLLDGIKDEVHKLNSQMAVFNSSHELKIVQVKSEIYDTVFNKLLEKEEFEKNRDMLYQTLEDMKKRTESKVDKNSVRVMWAVFTTAIIIVASFFKN